MRKLLGSLLLVLFPLSLSLHGQTPKCPETSHVVIEAGEYSPRPGVAFQLQNYAATMVPSGQTMPQCSVKMNQVEHGTITASSDALTKVFQQKLEQGKKHNITGLQVKAENDEIVISGTAHKGLPIHFSIKGPVSAVQGSILSLRAKNIHADGIPIKWLLNALGLELGNLMSPGSKGVTIQGDLLLFQLDKLAHVSGTISDAEVKGNDLVVEFGAVTKRNGALYRNPKDDIAGQKRDDRR